MERTPLVARPRAPNVDFIAMPILITVVVIVTSFVVFGHPKSFNDANEAMGSTEELFASYSNDSAPLVVDLHGWGGTPTGHRRLSGIDEIAQQYGMHAWWPSGYHRSWNAADGTYPPASSDQVDHVALLTARIAEIEGQYNVSRVILSGFSNGCAMVFKLLAESPRPFAAAICAGHYRSPSLQLATRATPLLVISGVDDPWVATDAQMNATLYTLAAENGCAGAVHINETDDKTLYTFPDCTQPVVNARLKGHGHSVYGPRTSALQKTFLLQRGDILD